MILKTERLTIRHIVADDWKSIKDVWVDFNTSALSQYDKPHITDDEDVRARIAKWAGANSGTEHMFFAICLGDIVIGYSAFTPKLVLPLVDFWARLLAGFSLWECNSRDTLSRSKTPVLFIHGKADTFVPCSMSQAGYDLCASDREIHLVDGAGHGRAYLYEPERLTRALTEFFHRNISDDYLLEG